MKKKVLMTKTNEHDIHELRGMKLKKIIVSPQTVKIVREYCEELGYVTNISSHIQLPTICTANRKKKVFIQEVIDEKGIIDLVLINRLPVYNGDGVEIDQVDIKENLSEKLASRSLVELIDAKKKSDTIFGKDFLTKNGKLDRDKIYGIQYFQIKEDARTCV